MLMAQYDGVCFRAISNLYLEAAKWKYKQTWWKNRHVEGPHRGIFLRTALSWTHLEVLGIPNFARKDRERAWPEKEKGRGKWQHKERNSFLEKGSDLHYQVERERVNKIKTSNRGHRWPI